MTIQADDPKLTAYVLGELNETERAEVEMMLKQNEAAREEVEAIRDAMDMLTAAFQQEATPALDAHQRNDVLNAAERGAPRSGRGRAWKGWGGLALAATFLAVLGASLILANPGIFQGYSLKDAAPLAETRDLNAPKPPPRDLGRMQLAEVAQQPPAPEAKPEPKPEPKLKPASVPAASAPPPVQQTQYASDGGLGNVGKKDASAVEKKVVEYEVPPQVNSQSVGQPKALSYSQSEMGAEPSSTATSAAEAKDTAPPPKSAGVPIQSSPQTYSYDINGSGPAQVEIYKGKDEKGLSLIESDGSLGTVNSKDAGYGTDRHCNDAFQNEIAPERPIHERRERLRLQKVTPATPPGTERYAQIIENRFIPVADQPLSTFSIDVDTASYANVRRFLSQGTFPPQDAVRIEEMINYFKYEYPAPAGETPFSVNVEVAKCPWQTEHMLARVGLKGKVPPMEDRQPANIVFLLDVSSSMSDANKLPLVKKAMLLLLDSLSARDRIGVVTYNETPRVMLESAGCHEKTQIASVIEGLRANGSTNGIGGIQLAYEMASRNFVQGGINRVVLATDGDFNVGVFDDDSIMRIIQDKAKSGVFLTVLGFGQGNLQDKKLETLADKGNGVYAYIDSFQEARRVMLEQVAGTMMTIAKDVKIQVEFNPAKVGGYRLIGYENRALAAKDFNDDRKDAGEIGAGHTVTALYELAPPGVPFGDPKVDALKYQTPPPATASATPETPATNSNDLMTVKLRYKQPESDTSARIDLPVAANVAPEPSNDFTFAASVAAFGMLLRDSDYKGHATFDSVLDWAQKGKGSDPDGRRAEFIDLVKTAKALAR